MKNEIKTINKVTKSNDLIVSTYKLTLQEYRIITMLISLVQPTDEHFQIYKFSVNEFQDLIGVKGNMHTYIKRIVTKLQEKTVEIPTKNSTLVVNWLASAEYFDKEGYIELEISNKLKPYLLGLKKRFTSYTLQNIFKLNSFYSMRIYELLKQYQFMKHEQIVIDLEVLRNWLGFIGDDKDKYQMYGHFNDKVLKVAKKEVNEKTDIKFQYKEVKSGRKVTGIEFVINDKDIVVEKQIEVVEEQIEEQGQLDLFSDDMNSLKEPLLSLGVKLKQIEKILKDYSIDQIRRNIEFTLVKKREGLIKRNVAGFCVASIKNDYAKVDELVNEDNTSKAHEQNGKKPVRTEVIPEWYDKYDKTEKIRTNGTIEEKRNIYLAEFGSVNEYEQKLIRWFDINKKLGNPIEFGLDKTFNTLIKQRNDLGIPLIKIEEFENEIIRRCYEESLVSAGELVL